MQTHKYKVGPNARSQGQAHFEYTHTTECGYVRDNVTGHDDEVTCKLCLREMRKHNPNLSKGIHGMGKLRTVLVSKGYRLAWGGDYPEASFEVQASSWADAKKKAWVEHGPDWDLEYVDFLGSDAFSLRRDKDLDLVEVVQDPILAQVSAEGLDIMKHCIYGGSDSVLRNHIFEKPDSSHIKALVDLDLVEPSSALEVGLNGYELYALTRRGYRATISMEKGARHSVDCLIESDPYQTREVSFINLEDVIRDRGLIGSVSKVYIRSGQWGSYWGPEGSGYTTDLHSAGIYTFEEAMRRSGHCGPEKHICFMPVNPEAIKTKIQALQDRVEEAES